MKCNYKEMDLCSWDNYKSIVLGQITRGYAPQPLILDQRPLWCVTMQSSPYSSQRQFRLWWLVLWNFYSTSANVCECKIHIKTIQKKPWQISFPGSSVCAIQYGGHWKGGWKATQSCPIKASFSVNLYSLSNYTIIPQFIDPMGGRLQALEKYAPKSPRHFCFRRYICTRPFGLTKNT